MPSAHIVRKVDVTRTPRVMQLEGMFDMPPSKRSGERWDVNMPLDERPWHIGLIVGPSGSGKTTVLREMFGDHIRSGFSWSPDRAVVDDFPQQAGIRDIVAMLNSVGFSSPPSWLRPFRVLSNGEQFRVFLARALLESGDICAIDEFTSVVDRRTARIGSAAVAKTVRRYDKKMIVASCHYDIEEWLQPDWVYQPHLNEFRWRRLRRFPEIRLKIFKVHRSAWKIFGKHHYLSKTIHPAAQCFAAFWGGEPVAFHCYLHFPSNRSKLRRTKRGHRVVCLPDYQGVGIGSRLEEFTAASLKALGFDYIIQTAHPARIMHCCRSRLWEMFKKPTISSARRAKKSGLRAKKGVVVFRGRLITSFRYVGPAGDPVLAGMVGYG